MNSEVTQDLNISEDYRYIVRPIGSRHVSPSTTFRYEDEYGTDCVDSWTGDVVSVHWAATEKLSSLVAETRCAELNAPATAITFPSKLLVFVDRAQDEEESPGDILEDVATITEWHLGRLRGLVREPLNQARLYIPAPEFKQ